MSTEQQRYGESRYWETARLQNILKKGGAIRRLVDQYGFHVPQGVPGAQIAGLACGQVLTIVGNKSPDELTGMEVRAHQAVQEYLG